MNIELIKKIEERSLRVSIVGFGHIGQCIGAVFAEAGFDVTGIDVNPDLINSFNSKEGPIREPGLKDIIKRTHPHLIRGTTDFSYIEECDLIIITVGTPIDSNNRPNLGYLISAAESICKHLHSGQVVVIKSTVPPTTTDKVVIPILENSGLRVGQDFHLGFCPERVAEGTALLELRKVPMIIGGATPQCTQIIKTIWSTALDIPTIEVSSPTVAEMCKLADNAFIDLNIALANEIAKLCDSLKIDVAETIVAANSLKKGQHYVNILNPSFGVGGACLTKDPWFMHHLGHEHGFVLQSFSASRQINNGMPSYSVSKIKSSISGKSLEKKRIAILGIAFKANTGDIRNTPALAFIKEVIQQGASITIHDPNVLLQDFSQTFGSLVLDSFENAIKNSDVVAVLAPHEEFANMDLCRLKKDSSAEIFFDGRNFFSRPAVTLAGFIYLGIGR